MGFIRELKGKLSAKSREATNSGTYQEETEDDAPDEQPPPDIEGNRHAVLGLSAVVKDLIGPLFGGQHGDGRENIQDVDKKVLEHDDVEPHIPRRQRDRRGELELCNSQPLDNGRFSLAPHST